MDKNIIQQLTSGLAFAPDRRIIGVSFIKDEHTYQNEKASESTHQLFFCIMVKVAASGKGIKVKKEHFYCTAAAKVLGFADVSEEIRSGQSFYERGMYESRKAAALIGNNIPYLQHTPYGMVIKPLEEFETPPDIVIIVSNAYTAMRIVQGYSYKYGHNQEISMTGMGGMCTELMARAYYNQNMNVSLLCSNTRFSGNWRDDELGIAMPGSMFKEVARGVLETMNLFEPDYKKREIIERAKKQDVKLDVELGGNYYNSCLGVTKMGVEGYRKK